MRVIQRRIAAWGAFPLVSRCYSNSSYNNNRVINNHNNGNNTNFNYSMSRIAPGASSASFLPDPILADAVLAAEDAVRRRKADFDAVAKFLAKNQKTKPPLPDDADDITTILWRREWTEAMCDAAEQRLRDAKEDVDRAEQRLDRAKHRRLTVAETIDYYDQMGKDSGKGSNKNSDKDSNTMSDLSVREVGRLCEEVGMCDFDRIAKRIEEITENIAKAPPKSDKSQLPLPCVIGTAGQGKTEVLLAVQRNENGIQQRMLNAYNNAYGKPVVDEVLTLFATFNQSTTYQGSETDNPVGALVGRLLAGRFNATWKLSDTLRVSDDLTTVLETLSSETDKQVLIVLLVDELRKIEIEGDRRAVVNSICAALSQSNEKRNFHLVPIVSCLDVTSLFTDVQARSKRPLDSIPLFPCPEEEIVKMDKLFKNNSKMYMHLCGGHYRSIEDVALKGDASKVVNKCVQPDYIKAVILLLEEILSVRHMNREVWLSESKKFDETSLWDLASQNFGVIYKKVDTENKVVCPAIAPYALMNSGKWYPTYHPSMPLFEELYNLLGRLQTHSRESLIKNWEQAVPIAEALYSGLTGKMPPYMEGLEKVITTEKEFIVEVPTKGNYNVTVHQLEGSTNEQRSQMIKAVYNKKRGIYCPKVMNYPGIELLHTVYGAAFVTQNKMRQHETEDTLVDIANKCTDEKKKMIASVTNGEEKKKLEDCIIIIIYVTNTDIRTCMNAAAKLSKREDVIKVGTPSYHSVYNKRERVCFVRGECVFEALEPLLGSVAKSIINM